MPYFPILSILLVSGIVFPPISAYTSVYITVLSSLVVFISRVPNSWHLFAGTTFKLNWAAFALLSITLSFVSDQIANAYILVVLLPILLAPGVSLIFEEDPKYAHPITIGFLCLVGAVAALGVALHDIYHLRLPRAGGGNNPIHFASLSLIIGYFALIGLFGTKSAWRYVFILGPVCGSAAALLSSSRGPLISSFILAILTFSFLIYWFWKERTFQVVALLGLALVGSVLAFGDSAQLDRARTITHTLTSISLDSSSLDSSTEQRLVLYSSAIEAFKESPIFGHGFVNFAHAAGKHMPEEYANMRNSEHLHSDFADFAVIGGTLGIVAYFCLLAAPLVVFHGIQDPEIRRATMLGGAILSVGYFSLGLTNAMFGILPQTMLYSVLLGILDAIGRKGRKIKLL